MFRPLTLFFIAVAGLITLNIGAHIDSTVTSVYGALAMGFGMGALCRSKEN